MQSPAKRTFSSPKKKAKGVSIVGLLLLTAAAVTMKYNLPQFPDLSNAKVSPPLETTPVLETKPVLETTPAVVKKFYDKPPSYIDAGVVSDIANNQFTSKHQLQTSFEIEGRRITVNSAHIASDKNNVFVQFRDGTNIYGATAQRIWDGYQGVHEIKVEFPSENQLKALSVRMSLGRNNLK